MAFDLPGYGASDPPKAPPRLEDYAIAVATALEALGYGDGRTGKVDISGYHTGAYVAIELLASRPDLFKRGVLLGAPFWQGEKLERQRKRLVENRPAEDGIAEDGRHVQSLWTGWFPRSWAADVRHSRGYPVEHAAPPRTQKRAQCGWLR